MKTYIEVELKGSVEVAGYSSSVDGTELIEQRDRLILLKGNAVLTAAIPAAFERAKERISLYWDAIAAYDELAAVATTYSLYYGTASYLECDRQTEKRHEQRFGIRIKRLEDFVEANQDRISVKKILVNPTSKDGIYRCSLVYQDDGKYMAPRPSTEVVLVTKPWKTLQIDEIFGEVG